MLKMISGWNSLLTLKKNYDIIKLRRGDDIMQEKWYLNSYSVEEDGIHVRVSTKVDGVELTNKFIFKSNDDYETMIKATGNQKW